MAAFPFASSDLIGVRRVTTIEFAKHRGDILRGFDDTSVLMSAGLAKA